MPATHPWCRCGQWVLRAVGMHFEFDLAKSRANARKHGIDFDIAQALWLDPSLTEIPARTTGEPRWLVVGLIDGRFWSAVVTYRGDRVRIISVRRSRPEEVSLYEEETEEDDDD